MKKNFLYLFTVLCTLSFFTACGDDDDPTPTPTPDPDPTPEQPTVLDVNADYSAETLVLTYSDSPLLGKVVTFKTEDGKTATITMAGTFDMNIIGGLLPKAESILPAMAPGVIPGEVSTTLSNVPLTLSGEKYTFEGTDSSNGREVKYSGEVTKGKLTMAIKATLSKNDLVGAWNLAPIIPGETAGSANLSQPFHIVWDAGDATIDMSAMGLGKLPVSAVATIGGGLVSPMVAGVLQSITYQEDGNIVASYKKSAAATDWETSPINLAQYYVKDGNMYVLLNIDQIMATVAANGTKAGMADIIGIITPLIPYLSQGVPLAYNVADGEATISAEKDLILQLLGLLTNETVAGMITGLIPADQQPLVQGIMTQLPGILEKTEDVSTSLVLVK